MKRYGNSEKFYEIFSPGFSEKISAIGDNQTRFVYYTAADTAMKVIENEELWFRNAAVMNDFSEISYGLSLIQDTVFGADGINFRTAIDSIFPKSMSEVQSQFSEWKEDWRNETYIASVSIHEKEEDERGRLSMWRAYGDTALVLNNEPMMEVTDLLKVFSIPALYLSKMGMAAHISKITNAISSNSEYLKSLNQEAIVYLTQKMLFQLAISTKHPGFGEEKEWRLYYRPNDGDSPGMTKDIVTLKGVPQTIFKLRLAHDPKCGLHHADIPSLLDRIIIGPTNFPSVTRNAFVEALETLKVTDPNSKVVISDIPLRIN